MKVPPRPEGYVRYPFNKMKIGDYLSLDFNNKKASENAQRCAHRVLKRNGYKAVTRKNGFNLQVWCVEME